MSKQPLSGRKPWYLLSIAGVLVLALLAMSGRLLHRSSDPINGGVFARSSGTTRYLAFQIFTGSIDSENIRESFPPHSPDYLKTVTELRDRIGMTGMGNRKLGVVLGPIAFDNSDQETRTLIGKAFDISLKTGVAIGFHIDDSMFWGRLKNLNTKSNLEWLYWSGTANTGRRLDWSAKPLKVMPQLCFNSKGVKAAVAARALLIGREVVKGIQKLKADKRDELFLGVIAGWETQIGRDFETGKYLGYNALTNAGFSAKKPPADIDGARAKIVADFISFWSSSLVKAGVPKDKVYSHIAFMSESLYKIVRKRNPSQFTASYLQTITFTPPETAFNTSCSPGFSTYPQPGHLEQLQAELKKHGNPSWASAEGTVLVPSEAESADSQNGMEGYLGNLFNHGAGLVNIFGWGVGDEGNPFRKTAESDASLAAYRKFLRGENLTESPLPAPIAPPPADLPEKIKKIQASLPAWVKAHGIAKAKPLMEKLDTALKQQKFEEAAKIADDMLKLISE